MTPSLFRTNWKREQTYSAALLITYDRNAVQYGGKRAQARTDEILLDKQTGLMHKRASFRCVFKTRCGLPRRALFLTGEVRRLSCRRSSMRALGGQCPGRDVFGPT